jgi:hypothetical protein
LFNRGYFAMGVPRLIPFCRLLGHRPVVDGYDNARDHRRWVACDRCGVRPDPQGSLDPARWNLGDRYTALLGTLDLPTDKQARFDALKSLPDFYVPGPWPTKPTGAFGAQILIGRHGLVGAGVKVGNAGSEHTLAAHLYLSPLFGITVHTERFGEGLRRRLNPTGWQSRVIDIGGTPGRLYWRIWAKRDEHSHDTPKWQHGSIRIDPRDILLGPKRFTYEKVGDPVTAVVRMPHGDDHEVTLQLERQRHGRKRGRRQRESWVVDWNARTGIPTKPHSRGGVYGSGVEVNDRDADAGTWPAAAAAAIAVDLTRDRARYGYRAPEAVEQ